MSPQVSSAGDPGFTLLEVMFALLVLSLGMVGLAMTVNAVDGADRETQRWTAAYRAAQTAMEEMLSAPFEELESGHNGAEVQTRTRDPGTGQEVVVGYGMKQVAPAEPSWGRGLVYKLTVIYPHPGDAYRDFARRDRFRIELVTYRGQY